MNMHVNSIEAFLEALRKEIEVPEHRYEQAEQSYMSLGKWLHREAHGGPFVSTIRRSTAGIIPAGNSNPPSH